MSTVPYRVRQATRAFSGPLNETERGEVTNLLGRPLTAVFLGMGPLGQRHGYDVYEALRTRGEEDRDLLASGLLHDVGKGSLGVVPRALWVLLGTASPALRERIARSHLGSLLALNANLHHAERGAEVVARAGGSPTLVRLIGEHKMSHPNDPLLVALRRADDAN